MKLHMDVQRHKLHRDAKADLIQHVPLFAGCSKRELQRIGGIADEVELKEGTVITRQGDSGREFFALTEGAVEVSRDGRTIATLRAGDFFGETALIARRPRNATVTATSAVHALVITDRDFRVLLDEMPQVQIKILRALADRVAPSEQV